MRRMFRNLIVVISAVIIITSGILIYQSTLQSKVLIEIEVPATYIPPGHGLNFTVNVKTVRDPSYGTSGYPDRICLNYFGNNTINCTFDQNPSKFYNIARFSQMNNPNYTTLNAVNSPYGCVPEKSFSKRGNSNFELYWNGTVDLYPGHPGKEIFENAIPGNYVVNPCLSIQAHPYDSASINTTMPVDVIHVCGPEILYSCINGNVALSEHFVGKYNNLPATVGIETAFSNESNTVSSNCSYIYSNYTLTNNQHTTLPKLNRTVKANFSFAEFTVTWGNMKYMWMEKYYAI